MITKPIDPNAPYERMKTYKNSLQVLTELVPGLKYTGKDDRGEFYKHPKSNGQHSFHVYFDSTGGDGLVHFFTNRLEPFEPEASYNTIQLIEQGLEADPMEYAAKHNWLLFADSDIFDEPLEDLVDMLESGKHEKPETPLIGHFIFRGQVTMLFGLPGTGKTWHLFELANALAGGEQLLPFLPPEDPMDSLYINFELNKDQLRTRYIKDGTVKQLHRGVYLLPDNLREYPWNPKSLGEYVRKKLTKTPNIAVVWIDNLSYLLVKLTDGEEAARFIRELRAVARELNIAMVVANHIPKLPATEELTMDSMSGSSQLRNLIDYQIGLRESALQPGNILLKEVKSRNAKKRYIGDNCQLFKLDADATGYVGFTLIGPTSEQGHMKVKSSSKVKELERRQAVRVAKRMQALRYSAQDIAACFHVNVRTVYKWWEVPPEPR